MPVERRNFISQPHLLPRTFKHVPTAEFENSGKPSEKVSHTAYCGECGTPMPRDHSGIARCSRCPN